MKDLNRQFGKLKKYLHANASEQSKFAFLNIYIMENNSYNQSSKNTTRGNFEDSSSTPYGSRLKSAIPKNSSGSGSGSFFELNLGSERLV